MPIDNNNRPEEALINEVDQSVRRALVSPSSESKLPWEDFKHNLQKESIVPVLERDEEGYIELNYKTETFNVDTFEQDSHTLKGVDLSVHGEVLEKVETQGAIQNLIKREELNSALVKNVQAGNSIEIDYSKQNPVFRIPENPELARQLNELPNDTAFELAQKTNSLITQELQSKTISFEKELQSDELGRSNGLKL